MYRLTHEEIGFYRIYLLANCWINCLSKLLWMAFKIFFCLFLVIVIVVRLDCHVSFVKNQSSRATSHPHAPVTSLSSLYCLKRQQNVLSPFSHHLIKLTDMTHTNADSNQLGLSYFRSEEGKVVIHFSQKQNPRSLWKWEETLDKLTVWFKRLLWQHPALWERPQ